MGDSIIYKIKSGKPNKFLNFLSGFAGLAIPDAFFRQRLRGLLAQAPKHPDYDYIRKRVDYYIKTNQPFHVSDTNRVVRLCLTPVSIIGHGFILKAFISLRNILPV